MTYVLAYSSAPVLGVRSTDAYISKQSHVLETDGQQQSDQYNKHVLQSRRTDSELIGYPDRTGQTYSKEDK